LINNEVIKSCLRGERKAHQMCYEKCAPYVYTIVKSYIYDIEMRKDAMQEVFANIFSSMSKYDGSKGSFKSWIASITVYQCIGLLRANKSLNILVPLDGNSEELSFEADELHSIKKTDIEALIINMPIGYRTIFMLSVVDEYSHKEIAKILNIDVGTSRSQLSRAIKWVKKNLIAQTKTIIYG